MIKFIYVILMNLFRAPYMIPKMRREADHPEKYSVEERYALARHVIRLMKVTGGIHTKSYGTELLPTEGGYMMYPNHQGKYDALGIIYTHREPCSLVMDKAKSNTILVREFVDLLQGKRLDKKDVRQALTIINEVSEEVKQGKRYILFPEVRFLIMTSSAITSLSIWPIAIPTGVPTSSRLNIRSSAM